LHGFEQRLGLWFGSGGVGGSLHPRMQTLRAGQSSSLKQGLSRSQAELRSTQTASKDDATAAAQPHWPVPSSSWGHVLLNGSQMKDPWRHTPLGLGVSHAPQWSGSVNRSTHFSPQRSVPSGQMQTP
jgi:hypothetical protein